MELITAITLSSGKRIRIPIFPHEFTDEYKIYTRGGAVQRIYQGNVLIYSEITDSELLELSNIFLGTSAEILSIIMPTTGGHRTLAFAWIYRRDLGEYVIGNPFINISDNENSININDSPNWGKSNQFFYNNEYVGSSEIVNYFDELERLKTLSTANQHSIMNLRYSSSIPSIDYATKNELGYDGFHLSTSQLSLNQFITNISNYLDENPDSDIDITIFDPDTNSDPYIVDDPSSIGGGHGDHDQDLDEIDKAIIPALPTLSAVGSGMITLYNCSPGQLNALAGYLWSDIFDVETNFKKMFASPMDCIIGLGIVPVQPNLGGAANVKFGNINTNISMSLINSQYVEVDCGSINLKEYIGSFLDYSPYVNISIYLPYIGFRDLSPDDVMNDTIHVVYHVDVLTGGCCAMIETSKKGLIYSYNGSCITNVPLTAINFSGAIQNAVSAIGAGATTIAGMATGAAPLTAMGATQLLSAGANTALNSKPSVTRSGSMGGSAGLMSYQKPYLVINRPRMSVPNKLNKFIGNTLNVTMQLSTVKGFTQVDLIHLDNIPCTDNERNELLTLLKGGVIF